MKFFSKAAAIAAFLTVPVSPLGPSAHAESPVVTTHGPMQKVIGPSGNIDSLYATVRGDDGIIHAYMSNSRTTYYDQKPDGTLTNARTILTNGASVNAVDHCGTHPVGAVYKDPNRKGHWITFYHGERGDPNIYGGECQGNGPRNPTRWAIYRLETFNGGRTWLKRGLVLDQDAKFLNWPTSATDPNANQDDAGGPRLVIRGNYMYLFYRAVNRHSPHVQQPSVARAPLSKLGMAGTWRKFYCAATCGFTEPGIGGQQSKVTGLGRTARGITWNSYLHRYIAISAYSDGIRMWESVGTDVTSWTEVGYVVKWNAGNGWGKECVHGTASERNDPMAAGYGAPIGWDYSSTETGQRFWVYFMYKPAGVCFGKRQLDRMEVTLGAASVVKYPRLTVSNGIEKHTPTWKRTRR